MGAELIIPVRMDVDKAIARLQKFASKVRRPATTSMRGAEKGQERSQDIEGGSRLRDQALAQSRQSPVRVRCDQAAAGAVGDEFKRAADYVKKLAEDFADLRKMMQELAALKGESGSNEFTVAEAKKARLAGLMPQEAARAQTDFMNAAGAMIGTEEKTG